MTKWYARRRWIYAALAAVIVFDVALYMTWLKDPAGGASASPAELAALEQRVAELSAEVDRLQAVRGHLPQMAPQIKSFSADRLVSPDAGFSQIATDLQEAAGSAGVLLRRVGYSLEEVKEYPAAKRIEVSTSIEGSYSSMLRYIEALQKSTRLYIIENIDASGTAGRGLRLEMHLSAYLSPDMP